MASGSGFCPTTGLRVHGRCRFKRSHSAVLREIRLPAVGNGPVAAGRRVFRNRCFDPCGRRRGRPERTTHGVCLLRWTVPCSRLVGWRLDCGPRRRIGSNLRVRGRAHGSVLLTLDSRLRGNDALRGRRQGTAFPRGGRNARGAASDPGFPPARERRAARPTAGDGVSARWPQRAGCRFRPWIPTCAGTTRCEADGRGRRFRAVAAAHGSALLTLDSRLRGNDALRGAASGRGGDGCWSRWVGP